MGKLEYIECLCGKVFLTTHRARWCTNKCRSRFYHRKNSKQPWTDRVKVYGVVGRHTDEEWAIKLKLFGPMCFWCHRELLDEDVTKDHLQPFSRGGTDYIDNVVPCCLRCNCRKGSKTAAEFRQFLENEKLRSFGLNPQI